MGPKSPQFNAHETLVGPEAIKLVGYKMAMNGWKDDPAQNFVDANTFFAGEKTTSAPDSFGRLVDNAICGNYLDNPTAENNIARAVALGTGNKAGFEEVAPPATHDAFDAILDKRYPLGSACRNIVDNLNGERTYLFDRDSLKGKLLESAAAAHASGSPEGKVLAQMLGYEVALVAGEIQDAKTGARSGPGGSFRRDANTATGTPGGTKDTLSNSEKDQIKALELLDKLYASGLVSESQNVRGVVQQLETLLLNPHVSESVKHTIRSELALQDTYFYIRRANGNMTPPPLGGDHETPTLGAAVDRALGRGREVNRKVLSHFFVGSKEAEAFTFCWDFLQKHNVQAEGYVSLVNAACDSSGISAADKGIYLDPKSLEIEIDNDPDLGKAGRCYFTDNNPERKKIVYNHVLDEMRKASLCSEGDCERVFRHVEMMMLVSGEVSFFNRRALAGNDQLAEKIGFKDYRINRRKKGRDKVGTEPTMEPFKSIATSWFRFKCEHGGKSDELSSAEIISKLSKFSDGDMQFFYSIYLGDVSKMSDLVLDSTPDSKKFSDVETFKGLVNSFLRIDPKGEKRLRFFFVSGLIQGAILSQRWIMDDYIKLRRAVSMLPLSDDGTAGSFLTDGEMEKLWKYYAPKMVKSDLVNRASSIADGVINSIFSQKK